jgi:hypothetical protein
LSISFVSQLNLVERLFAKIAGKPVHRGVFMASRSWRPREQCLHHEPFSAP